MTQEWNHAIEALATSTWAAAGYSVLDPIVETHPDGRVEAGSEGTPPEPGDWLASDVVDNAPKDHHLVTLRVVRPVVGERRAGLRRFKIKVDGKVVAKLGVGESTDIQVTPSKHLVVARVDWTGSPTVLVDMSDGRDQVLEVTPAGTDWEAVWQLASPDRYLTLRRIAPQDSQGRDAVPLRRSPPVQDHKRTPSP